MIGGGYSYVSAPPAFSTDAKRLLVCTGTVVSVFSTSTALQVSTLEGHTALVTSVLVVPGNKSLSFCWTASLDGTVRYWDYVAAELMKTIDIKMPIYSMVIPALLLGQTNLKMMPADAFAYLSVENTQVLENSGKGLRGQIRKCNLTESWLAGVILAETRKPEVISISPSGKFFGIRNKRKLHIWKTPAKDSKLPVAKITLHHTRNFTLLAFHPTKRLVAAGDTSGRILIWRGFGNRTFSDGEKIVNRGLMNDEEEKPGTRGNDDADSCTTWHWHPTGINLLRFSSDGAYLYSGGKEGVLVDWQLDTGKKKFLPRIGSPLIYLTDSLDPTLSAITCADNQIHLLKMPSMEITKSISGIKLPFSFPEVYDGMCSKFAFDDTAGLVALRAENYRIQFYSLFDDREISEVKVQVCERNHQPGDEVSVIVTLVSLSGDGSMMSTLEVNLPEDGIGGLVCLKFWASDPQNKNFNLSTIVYEPHRDAGISAVAFHPTCQMVVSSSYGGDFKIWVCSDEIPQKQDALQHSGWMCHAVGSYKKKPMTAAAFSADGSVLALAAETVITLWDPDNNMLVAVLGEMQMPILTLSFAGEYLLSISRGSKPQLSVWSMSKLSESWSYKLDIEDVTCAKDSSSFAVLALLPKSSNEPIFQGKDGLILLFNATDPVPLAMWSVRKAKGGGLAFLKGNSPSFQHQSIFGGKSPQALLAYINADHEYILFDPYDNDASELSLTRTKDHISADETAQFGYTSIYCELPQFEMKTDQNLLAPYAPSQRAWETIFSGSSRNLLPLPKLCLEFMESLLERRTTTVE
ncbi:hypothetical protein ACLB2K_038100 [Fragaria x ananassa]